MNFETKGLVENKLSRDFLILCAKSALFFGIFYYIITNPGLTLASRSLWVGLALFVVFLRPGGREENLINAVLILIVTVTTIYIVYNHSSITARLIGATQLEIVLGLIFLLVVLEGTRRSMGISGKILAGLTLISLIYMAFGHIIPSRVTHAQLSIDRIVWNMYLTTDGAFSFILGTVINYVVPFVVFGKILEKVGGTDYFIMISKYITKDMVAGSAKLSVVASSLMGTISGTVVGNIATTGTVTLPTMKKDGTDPEYAAAIESAASTGGQIMPPIMGIAIFLMVNIIGISYLEIATRSLIPAILYFAGIFLFIHLLAKKGTGKISLTSSAIETDDLSDKSNAIKKAYFLIPVIAIVVLLVQGRPIPTVGVYGCALLLILGLVQPENRLTIRKGRDIIEESMELTSSLIIITASIGIFVSVAGSTGIQLQFTSLILTLSGGHMIAILILTMLAAILLGMGMSSTVVAYLILATLIAPALVNIGFEPLVAHLFVFYFGMFALITPPVGVGIFTAASMAECDPMSSGLIAMKLCAPGFILPYLFAINDSILLYGSSQDIVIAISLAILVLFLTVITMVGYFTRILQTYERVLSGTGAAIGVILIYLV